MPVPSCIQCTLYFNAHCIWGFRALFSFLTYIGGYCPKQLKAAPFVRDIRDIFMYLLVKSLPLVHVLPVVPSPRPAARGP
jgi:hypothetical protein